MVLRTRHSALSANGFLGDSARQLGALPQFHLDGVPSWRSRWSDCSGATRSAAARQRLGLRGGDKVHLSDDQLRISASCVRNVGHVAIFALGEARDEGSLAPACLKSLSSVFVVILDVRRIGSLKPTTKNPGKALYQLRPYRDHLPGARSWHLLLSTFSLPGDFKSKTIYTIVTKPVSAHGEIILGRILGFTASSARSCSRIDRGICSYHLRRTRSLETYAYGRTRHLGASLRARPLSTIAAQRGRTSRDAYHRHDVELEIDIERRRPGSGDREPRSLSPNRAANGDQHHAFEPADDFDSCSTSRNGAHSSFLDRQGVRKRTWH